MSHKDFDLGFLGGGQLARMSIQAAQRMGLKCISLDPGEDTPASQIAEAIIGKLDDPKKVAEVLQVSRRVTLENEFIPADAIREACEIAKFNAHDIVPRIETLEIIQDKLLQRHAMKQAGVPSPNALAIESDGEQAIETIGFPMVLKARFGGYDGKGTRYAKTRDEFDSYRDLWGKGGWLAEDFVPFKREVAAMVYISEWGAGAFPTMETIQTNHVCDLVFPSGVDATPVAIAAVEAVGGYGLFGVEMFELEDGQFLINELAPRPHNTGHYTLDWGGITQFEQHVRLAMGLPTVRPQGNDVCMANLLGQAGANDFRCGLTAVLEDPSIRFHWYGKAESRPGRKMGHLNAVGEGCVEKAKAARMRFYEAWTSA
ncbi:MAG: ATP-grasp domain-containing protein [Fimbriimonadaceae bacterium]|nr:ATP-grasp domain-containing protein [Fimbriimonadaceae bacterium]